MIGQLHTQYIPKRAQ